MINMNTLKIVFDFGKWYNSSEFPEDLKNVEDTEVLVLAYADKYEIDLNNYLDNICDLVDKYVFELYF